MKHLGRLALMLVGLVAMTAIPAFGTAVARPIRSNSITGAVVVDAISPSPICKPSSSVVCITAAGSGKVTVARVGERVEVLLGEGGLAYSGLHEALPSILRLVSGPTDQGGVARATYLAVRTGETFLVASAGPRCEPDEACPDFIMLFSRSIRVVR